MSERDEIEFYAKAYNTIQEIVWTHNNEELNDWMDKLLWKWLKEIDEYVNKNDCYTEEDRDEFLKLTDHIRDRIYFNC